MLTFLIAISLLGFLLSKHLKLGPFNPFTLFFGIWSAIFIAYSIFQHVYYPISGEYLLIQICIHLFALFMMFLMGRPTGRFDPDAAGTEYRINKLSVNIIQILLLAGLPALYQNATELAGGSIFTSQGYTRLRYSFNVEGENVGWMRYLTPLSFITSAVVVYFAAKGQLPKWRALLALLTGVCYAYLATGRTFFLLVFILTFMPLAVTERIRTKSLLLLGSILMGLFFMVATLTSKGTSEQASLGDNILGFIDSMQSYLLAPFVALSMLFDKLDTMHMGDYSLRFFISLLASQGLTDPPAPIVKGYQFTPVPTNLYSVYEVYFRDFGAIGFFIPLVFLPLHWVFYKQARKGNDFFVLMYAVSAYPLLTQILQDQYMTLISTWIQIFIACLLMIRKEHKSYRRYR